jgi:hypothetical protein
MRKRFIAATTAPKDDRFVIVYAWPEVPDTENAKPYPVPVLKFLCDAHRAGCRVIVTSSAAADSIMIDLLTASETLSEANPDLGDLRHLETIDKIDLQKMTKADKIKVDLALDHKSIAKSKSPYIQPDAEVNIGRDGKPFPLTIEGVYAYCGLNKKTGVGTQCSTPVPKSFA